MKILVLSNEVWNDRINGNNVTTNWFEGMDGEFANIYCSPGDPYNDICRRYFQITDMMMAKSVFGRKAGREVHWTEEDEKSSDIEQEPEKLYSGLKKISGPFLRLIRECIWLWGWYDLVGMRAFVDDFQPDVIFSERMASAKMLRLERLAMGMTNAPMFAFTGDDEYTLQQVSFSPFFWINRFMVRDMLRKNVQKYRIYYMHSADQKALYEREFGIHCKLICKCGEFPSDYRPEDRKLHSPIRLIYAGKFYCNRWKVLSEVADALREINRDGVKMVLNIYTGDVPTRRQNELLNDGVSSIIHGRVSEQELAEKYREADIALHVESSDLRNRQATRLSFSTKIIDCIFSGCAVMAYCPPVQSGWKYLHDNDAAICVSSNAEMKAQLQEIVENPSIINEYREKAYRCGIKNHLRENVQKMLMEDFETACREQA